MNSAALIAQARRVYFLYLERSASGSDPLGVVISTGSTRQAGHQGRVVFELPVLLPEEHYIPLDLVRGRPGRSRTSRPPLRS